MCAQRDTTAFPTLTPHRHAAGSAPRSTFAQPVARAAHRMCRAPARSACGARLRVGRLRCRVRRGGTGGASDKRRRSAAVPAAAGIFAPREARVRHSTWPQRAQSGATATLRMRRPPCPAHRASTAGLWASLPPHARVHVREATSAGMERRPCINLRRLRVALATTVVLLPRLPRCHARQEPIQAAWGSRRPAPTRARVATCAPLGGGARRALSLGGRESPAAQRFRSFVQQVGCVYAPCLYVHALVSTYIVPRTGYVVYWVVCCWFCLFVCIIWVKRLFEC